MNCEIHRSLTAFLIHNTIAGQGDGTCVAEWDKGLGNLLGDGGDAVIEDRNLVILWSEGTSLIPSFLAVSVPDKL